MNIKVAMCTQNLDMLTSSCMEVMQRDSLLCRKAGKARAASLSQKKKTEIGRTFCRACAALLRLNDRSDQAGCHHDNPEALRVCKDWKLHSWIYGKKGKKKKTGGWGGRQGVCSLKMVQYGAVDYA